LRVLAGIRRIVLNSRRVYSARHYVHHFLDDQGINFGQGCSAIGQSAVARHFEVEIQAQQGVARFGTAAYTD
jgi:hypothetical protein